MSEFWDNHIARKNDPESICVGGHHYRLSNPILAEKGYRGMLGFGGREWTIEFNDGRVVKTNNLWHQGEIPESVSKQLPDNAKFGSVAPIGGTYAHPRVG